MKDNMQQSIAPQQLNTWKQLASAATPGPWQVDSTAQGPAVIVDADEYVCTTWEDSEFDQEADAAFIAAAREAVPALIAEVERLTALLQAK
jgi:hypothetical protein